MENINKSKILIVRLSAIGDTIHSLPIAAALKNSYPDICIHWLVEPEQGFLLKDNPIIDKVIIFDKNSYKKQGICFNTLKNISKLISNLKKERYDIAIDLQGLFKSGILTWLSSAKRKIGFKNTREFAEFFLSECINAGNMFDESEHVIQKNLKLAQYLGATDTSIRFILPNIPENVNNKVDSLLNKINTNLPTMAILPATLWKSKHWPIKYWQELLKKLENKVNLIIIGSHKDMILANEITQNLQTETLYNLSGKTNLIDLIEIFNRTDIVIGVDTGTMHLAVATGKPKVISILGPTSAVRNGAFEQVNLYHQLSCQPCNKKICPLKNNNYMLCLNSIKPETVFNEVIKINQEITNQ